MSVRKQFCTMLIFTSMLLPILIYLYAFGCVFSQAVDAALDEDQPNRALLLSLRLNEDNLIKKCIFAVSPVDIAPVASSIPQRYLQRFIEALADLLESCQHMEFILRWCQVLSSLLIIL